MGYEAVVQSVLEEIDRRIKEDVRAEELARAADYSLYHFRRIFMEVTGMPVMNYIVRRKLEFALYELSLGRKIVDVALDYGFETHAGFTKAFKKAFGSPPSLYCMHVSVSRPEKAVIHQAKWREKVDKMQFIIKETEAFDVVGYVSRHRMPGVGKITDIPGYWEKINLEYDTELSTLHNTYPKSHHCEVAICFDVDEEEHCFSYMLGVGVDAADSDVRQRPGTWRQKVGGGLYAIFTTPAVDEAHYVQAIHDTWREILENWLVNSDYEYDCSREGYEYYDERDHGSIAQMDICVPILKR